MTALEKKLLHELQFDFPLSPRPFRDVAGKLGVSEAAVIRATRRLKKMGYIKRIGPAFDLRRLGFHSTLVAMRVPRSAIRKTAAIINSYPEVTHNYLRNGKFNIWFTVIAPSSHILNRVMNQIKMRTGAKEIVNLKTRKVYKIDARFSVSP